MPEGPELLISSLYINESVKGLIFAGNIVTSEVTKNPSVEWDVPSYTITASSRGKEMKLTLKEYVTDNQEMKKERELKEISILFRFGMSGCFKMSTIDDIPKHSHLRFYTSSNDQKPVQVLNFVDFRRFGHWLVNADWSPERGPCPITDYENFRMHVLGNLEKSAFKGKPICEVMLNQKYFNGIGNYLRAEILFRSKIPPFEDAYTELIKWKNAPVYPIKAESAIIENTNVSDDPLFLCNKVCHEVLKLSGGYDVLNGLKEDGAFEKWLQCYQNPEMKCLVDKNKRTIWFDGEPGSLVPLDCLSRKPIRKRKIVEEKLPESLTVKKETINESKKLKVLNNIRLPTRRSPRFLQGVSS